MSALLPEHNIGHTIVLEPGCRPPFMHACMHTAESLLKLRQIAGGIAHGHVEPRSSPQSTILLVQEKDGTLRMCD